MDRICSLLALATDRRTVIDGVDGAHRCHATDAPVTLERQLQSQLCLTASHDRCERFRAFSARTGLEHPGRSSLADGMVTTRLVLAPEPAWRGMAGRARRARRGTFAAAGAGVVVIGLGGAAVTSVMGGGIDLSGLLGPTTTPAALGTPTPSERQSATETPTATPVATAEPPASAVPSASPIPSLIPAPTPAPTTTPVQSYTVTAGDTLAVIAQRFATTVAALQAANGIEDPNEIVIGQVLVIP